MPITLHAAAVPLMRQIIGAAPGWLDKAAASGRSEAEIAEARLIGDMLPFAYQIKSMAVHSMGAFRGLEAGVFSPDMTEPDMTFAGMRAKLAEADAFLAALEPGTVDALVGRDMRFEIPGRNFVVPFTAENFLLGFSLPNVLFHASTAYGILRMLGVDVGKRDFLGAMPVKAG